MSLAQNERQALILSHHSPARRMAWAMLKKWRRYQLCRKEVESVIGISLCEAAARYNHEYGSFLTLLHYYLRGNLLREFFGRPNTHETLPATNDHMELILNRRSLSERERTGQTASRKALAVLLSSEIAQGLPSLEPDEREVFKRAFMQGQTVDEISAALCSSRSHIGRVRQSAVTKLEALYGV